MRVRGRQAALPCRVGRGSPRSQPVTPSVPCPLARGRQTGALVPLTPAALKLGSGRVGNRRVKAPPPASAPTSRVIDGPRRKPVGSVERSTETSRVSSHVPACVPPTGGSSYLARSRAQTTLWFYPCSAPDKGPGARLGRRGSNLLAQDRVQDRVACALMFVPAWKAMPSSTPRRRAIVSRRSHTPSRAQRMKIWAAVHQGPSSAGAAPRFAPFWQRQTMASTVRRRSEGGTLA